MKNFYFRKSRLRVTWLSGSKSRCSISSTEKVLLIDGKKKQRPKIGAIFKRIGRFVLNMFEVLFELSTNAELVLIIMNWLGW